MKDSVKKREKKRRYSCKLVKYQKISLNMLWKLTDFGPVLQIKNRFKLYAEILW